MLRLQRGDAAAEQAGIRELLERPFEDTGRTAFEWMVGEYRRLEPLAASWQEQLGGGGEPLRLLYRSGAIPQAIR